MVMLCKSRIHFNSNLKTAVHKSQDGALTVSYKGGCDICGCMHNEMLKRRADTCYS